VERETENGRVVRGCHSWWRVSDCPPGTMLCTCGNVFKCSPDDTAAEVVGLAVVQAAGLEVSRMNGVNLKMVCVGEE